MKAETSDYSSPHPTGTSRAAPDALHLTFSRPWAFSGTAGELRATRSVLEADLNGDSLADFAVNLRSNTLISSNNLML